MTLQSSDFQPGLDLSSLSSVTQAQLMQALAQLLPLSNMGGVIFQAGTSLAASITQATNGAPDVTNNPRFARYIWLNTYAAATSQPTPYYYNTLDSKWYSTSIAALTITNAEISASAAIAVTKLATGTARFLVRTNAAGTANEFVNPNSILTNNDVPLIALEQGAAPADAFLRRVSGGSSWQSFTSTLAAIQNALTGVPVTALAAGANNTLLGTGSGGVVAMDTPNNLIPNLGLNLGKLAAGGASARQLMQWDGSAWSPVTPSLQINGTLAVSTTGYDAGVTLSVGSMTFLHGLGATPKLVRVVAVLQSPDGTSTASNTYSPGDEIDIMGLESSANNPAFSIMANSTTIDIAYRATGAPALLVKARASAFAAGAIDETLWTFKVYAWR